MKNETYRKTVKQVGKVYFRLAAEWGRGKSVPETRAEALRKMSRIHPARGKKYRTRKERKSAADTVREIARTVFFARQNRWAGQARKRGIDPNPARIRKQNAKRPDWIGGKWIPILPSGTLRERAEMRAKVAVRKWVNQNVPEHSGEFFVYLAIGEPSAKTETEKGETYSKRCTYRRTDAHHSVTIPETYFRDVIRRNMVEVDGMLTLSLNPITHANRTVYAAKWVRVAGKRLKMETGYIACDGEQTAHAKTPQAACAILTRRETDARFQRLSRKIREKLDSMRLNGYGEIEVSLADSVRAGNCRSGSEHFRDKHFPGRTTATVREVLEVGEQKNLVLNACLHAIRRENKLEETE